MKKSPLTLICLFLLVSVLFSTKSISAAPPAQGEDQVIQIVLVMDVSGSMSTPVYTGIVPEDLLSLLLRMDELNNESEYLDLQDQLEEAENNPEVQDAKQTNSQAFEELTDWIEENQGTSLPGIRAAIRSRLNADGCQDTSDRLIATAGNSEQIMFYLNADCPATANKWTLLTDLQELVPYLTDPDYLSLREEWQTAYRAYDQALEDSGYTSLSDQLEAYKENTGLDELQDEIDRLVVEYGIPSRLELAKSAALNLIDISELDQEQSGRDSQIGLVTFSNQAMFEHSLTSEHEVLKPLIRSMSPLEQTNIGDALSMGLQELESNADLDQAMMVILLSDGHANIGLTSSQILSVIPPRANQNDIILCTAGFADLETEVDFLLLEGLAFQTGGEYLFTNSGAELGSFFAACREAAAGKNLAGQLSGIAPAGEFLEAGQVDIEANTCELSLVLNHLSGRPRIELIDPDRDRLDLESEGVSYQIRNQVQLVSIPFPRAGVWTINLSNENDQAEDAAYSLVISTVDCQGDENPPEMDENPDISVPYLLTSKGLNTLTIMLVIGIVLLIGAVVLVIRFRMQRNG